MVERRLISLPSQLQLIDRLQHLIYLSSSLIFISGETGSGKSTLVEQLSNCLPGNIQEVFIQLNEQLSNSQIRQKIIQQLYKQPLFNVEDSLLTSMLLLQEKHSREAHCVIILDNAHFIKADLLVELADVITHKAQLGESEINLILLADDDNKQQMISLIKQTAQKTTYLEFKIEQLALDESKSLLSHIFTQIGYQPEVQHQDALLKQLTACAGIPQKVIQLAEQISEGQIESKEPSWLKQRFPAILLMLALIIVAAGLVYYLYPKYANSLKPITDIEAVEDDASLPSTPNEMPLVAGNDADTADETPATLEKLAGNWSKQSEINDNPLAVGISDKSVERIIISEQQLLNLAADKKSLVYNDPIIEAANKDSSRVMLEVHDPAMDTAQNDALDNDLVAKIIKAKNVESTLQQPEENNNPPDAEGLIAENKPADSALKLKQSKAIKDEKSGLVAKDNPVFTERVQLLAIAPSHYTLQLAALSAEDSLIKFIAKHNLPRKDVYIYQTTHKDRTLYVIIFGEYKSRQLAKMAAKSLPGSLKNMNIWIKKYQLVHQDLQLNNE
jgi:DamX protein